MCPSKGSLCPIGILTQLTMVEPNQLHGSNYHALSDVETPATMGSIDRINQSQYQYIYIYTNINIISSILQQLSRITLQIQFFQVQFSNVHAWHSWVYLNSNELNLCKPQVLPVSIRTPMRRSSKNELDKTAGFWRSWSCGHSEHPSVVGWRTYHHHVARQREKPISLVSSLGRWRAGMGQEAFNYINLHKRLVHFAAMNMILRDKRNDPNIHIFKMSKTSYHIELFGHWGGFSQISNCRSSLLLWVNYINYSHLLNIRIYTSYTYIKSVSDLNSIPPEKNAKLLTC